MRSCLSVFPASRGIAAACSLVLVLVLLSGCNTETYPTELAYPLRTDPVVTGNITYEPPAIDRPGQLNHILDMVPEADRQRVVVSPSKLSDDDRQALEKGLREVFGTPAEPKIGGLSDDARKMLLPHESPEEALKQGSRLYRQHCLHCHGLTGDGHGPTAPWVNPHPRDYRQGSFKFTSTSQSSGSRKARRDDLLRVLREGIDGTSMPSFRLLADNELEAIVSYVIHLSMRGEAEALIIKESLGGNKSSVEEVMQLLLAKNWLEAQTSLIQPAPYPAAYHNRQSEEFKGSVRRGFRIFTRKAPDSNPKTYEDRLAGNCVQCHIDFGRQNKYMFDAWGTIVRPTDLTLGLYRGGRRPIDLYWRISHGINGAGMPASNEALVRDPKDPNAADPVWDVVNFLQMLPYANMRKTCGLDIE